MKLDKNKLTQVFESSGIDNSQEIVESLETFIQTELDTQVEEATSSLIQSHAQEIADLNKTMIEEKQSLIETQLSEIEESKKLSKNVVEALVNENEELTDQVEDFENIKEQLVEFTINEANKEYDEKLEMFFAKVAEEWVDEKDEELDYIAESKAMDLGTMSIAEALSQSGFNLLPEDDSVAEQLTDLEEEYTLLEEENTILKSALKDIEKEVLIEEAVTGLSTLEGDKLRSIAEKMEFKNSDSFSMALKFMQESVSNNDKGSRYVSESHSNRKPVTRQPVEEHIDVTNASQNDHTDLIAATLAAMK